MSAAKHTPGPVTEADIASAREHIADVHNMTQMVSACSQLRREVVAEMANRGFVPSFYATDMTKARASKAQARAAIAKATGGAA